MCEWGTNINLRVPIPAGLSYTRKRRWAAKAIDACIAPIVDALNKAGIFTANCCCGHGKTNGSIILHNGRKIIFKMKTRFGKNILEMDVGDCKQ